MSGPRDATTYDLSAPAVEARTGSPAGPIVVIPEPNALSTLNSERVVVKPASALVNYYPGAQWSDRLPRLIQARMIQAFENANRLRSVGRPDDRLAADYQLVTDLRAFEVLAGGQPTAFAEMSVKIVGASSGKIFAARIFSARVPVADDDVNYGIAGLDAALGEILAELVPWAIARL